MKNRNICSIPSCRNYQSYCRLHQGYTVPVKSEIPKKSDKQPIRKRSKKLAKVMRKDYVPQVKKMVEEQTECELKTEVCTGMAQGFHHPHGRTGELLMKKKVPSCNPCNLWVEVFDKEAREKGLKKSKFSIPAKNQLIKKAS
jgi:hypothetical protein